MVSMVQGMEVDKIAYKRQRYDENTETERPNSHKKIKTTEIPQKKPVDWYDMILLKRYKESIESI
jgi:hypothetical protein